MAFPLHSIDLRGGARLWSASAPVAECVGDFSSSSSPSSLSPSSSTSSSSSSSPSSCRQQQQQQQRQRLWLVARQRTQAHSVSVANIKRCIITCAVLVTCATHAAAAGSATYKAHESQVNQPSTPAGQPPKDRSVERQSLRNANTSAKTNEETKPRDYDSDFYQLYPALPPYLVTEVPRFPIDAVLFDSWTLSLREHDPLCDNLSDASDSNFVHFLRNLSTGNLLSVLLENSDIASELDRLVMCLNSTDSDGALAAGNDSTGNESEAITPGLRVPIGEAIIVGLLLSSVVFATIFGNFLVVISVFTYKPLKNVPNILIASLAVSDFAVAFLVMPFNIYDTLVQPWMLGHIVCEVYTTSDVFFCTSSILNLCAIAVDRYHAIHDPLNYAQKRTAQRMMITVAAVYVASGLISVPPLLGWKETRPHEHCALSDNKVYVIISALGSFYIPCFVMCFVYVNIFLVARRRLRQRAKHSAAKVNSVKLPKKQQHESNTPTQPHPPTRFGSTYMWRLGRARRLLLSKSKNNCSERSNSPRLVEPADTDNSKSGSSNENAKQQSGATVCVLSYARHEAAIAAVQPDRKKSDESVVSTPEDAPNSPQISTIAINLSNAIKSFDPASVASEQNGKPSGNQLAPIGPLQPGGPSFLKSFAAERQKISLSRERKAARTLAILGGTFLISWLPFFIWYLIGPFCERCQNLDKSWINFLVWLGYANSATNPVLYTVFNADFRRAFQKLLHLPQSDRRQPPRKR